MRRSPGRRSRNNSNTDTATGIKLALLKYSLQSLLDVTRSAVTVGITVATNVFAPAPTTSNGKITTTFDPYNIQLMDLTTKEDGQH